MQGPPDLRHRDQCGTGHFYRGRGPGRRRRLLRQQVHQAHFRRFALGATSCSSPIPLGLVLSCVSGPLWIDRATIRADGDGQGVCKAYEHDVWKLIEERQRGGDARAGKGTSTRKLSAARRMSSAATPCGYPVACTITRVNDGMFFKMARLSASAFGGRNHSAAHLSVIPSR